MSLELQRIPNNIRVAGWLRAKGFTLTDDGTPILASALQHQPAKTFSQNGVATDFEIVLHLVEGDTATVRSFSAGAILPSTDDAVTAIDLLKNGASIHDDPISLSDSQTAYEAVAGALASTSLVEGDVLSATGTVTSGTGVGDPPEGLFVELRVNEDYA